MEYNPTKSAWVKSQIFRTLIKPLFPFNRLTIYVAEPLLNLVDRFPERIKQSKFLYGNKEFSDYVQNLKSRIFWTKEFSLNLTDLVKKTGPLTGQDLAGLFDDLRVEGEYYPDSVTVVRMIREHYPV